MINFARWMDETGARDDVVAKDLGIDQSTIWRIRNSKRRASGSLIERLVKYSVRCVDEGRALWPLRPDDFFEITDLPESVADLVKSEAAE